MVQLCTFTLFGPHDVACAICRYDVDGVAALVSEYTHDIGHALDALRVSGQLQYLLAFVRDVANTMNRAHKGPLTGFKLESLARLQVRVVKVERCHTGAHVQFCYSVVQCILHRFSLMCPRTHLRWNVQLFKHLCCSNSDHQSWLAWCLLLQSTKMAGATDLNLLHYIVAHLSAVLPGVLVLDAEREAFRAACKRGTFDAGDDRLQ